MAVYACASMSPHPRTSCGTSEPAWLGCWHAAQSPPRTQSGCQRRPRLPASSPWQHTAHSVFQLSNLGGQQSHCLQQRKPFWLFEENGYVCTAAKGQVYFTQPILTAEMSFYIFALWDALSRVHSCRDIHLVHACQLASN